MRIPKPYFRKQTKSWYVQIHRKQINLGPDKDTALQLYHSLMADQTPKNDHNLKVVQLFDAFLEWCKNNRSERTYEFYLDPLKKFSVFIGGLKVGDLKPYHVTQWIDTLSTDGVRFSGVRSIKRAFNWGLDEGYIEKSPVARIKRPPQPPREVYVTPENWRAFLAAVKPGPFLDAVLFMRYTGCRPQELCIIEARHVDGDCIVLQREESKGKKTKRVIPLTKKAKAIVDKLLVQHPTGLLFRTTTGKKWTRDSFNTRFDKFEKQLGFKIYSYAIRHTFITDCLTAGMDPVKLANICGHKDLKMIHTVYSHLQLKQGHLRDELERFTGDVDPPADNAA
jgi:integrase